MTADRPRTLILRRRTAEDMGSRELWRPCKPSTDRTKQHPTLRKDEHVRAIH